MLLSVVLLPLSGLTACAGPDPGPPNVLLISIDSLRADHVGAYGYQRDTTPTIDHLANEGALFTTVASSSSWTLPAHVAMLTGLFDFEHGVMTPGHRLQPGITTLAESFKAAGYQTYGLYSGPFLHPDFGFSQGFDEYIDCTSYNLEKVNLKREPGVKSQFNAVHDKSHGDVTNPTILREARRLFRRIAQSGVVGKTSRQQPLNRFFMFVHMFDVHYDFIPPAPYNTIFFPDYQGDITSNDFLRNKRINRRMPRQDLEKILALYDGEIRFTDDTIGQLLESMREDDLLSNTIVVVTADHGDEFFEHGGKGHRRNLYEETVRIPLVVWYPPAIRPGRIDEVVRVIDIAPTLLEMCSLPATESVPEDPRLRTNRTFARSLLPLIGSGGNNPGDSRPAVCELLAPKKISLSSIRVGDSKLVIDAISDTVELFDLDTDPGEQHAVTNDPNDPEVVRLTGILQMLQRSSRGDRENQSETEVDLDPRIEQQLRELGYIE